MKKIKKILMIILVVIIVGVLVKVGLLLKEKYFFEDMTDKSLEIMNVHEPFSYEIIEKVLKKNQDWSDINDYLSEEFKKRYNEKDGFLEDVDVKDAYLDMEYAGENFNRIELLPFIVETIDGLKYRYYIRLIGNYHAENYEIVDYVLIDNNNNPDKQEGLKFTENTFNRLLYDLMFTNNGEAGLSKKFIIKYPNFDGLYNKNGLPLERINYNGEIIQGFKIKYAGIFDYDANSWNKVEIIDSYRGISNICNIKFKLDDENYLDDYEMIITSKGETNISSDFYRTNPTYESIVRKLSGKNRDWKGLPLSYNFLNKYNEVDGIFNDLNVDYLDFLCDTKGKTKYPVLVHLIGGEKKYYGLIFILTNTNIIDDLVITELDVDNTKDYKIDELLNKF